MFNDKTWKTRIGEIADRAGAWLTKRNGLPLMAYTTVAGLSVWPLVEAAAKAGAAGNTAMLPHLYTAGLTVMAGVGGNLIAEQIQRWFDSAQKGEPPTEESVGAWLAEVVDGDEEVRDQLDHLIETFDTIPTVRNGLPTVEQANFLAQLRADTERLGNSAKFANTISNSQIAIGDNARAAGDKANIIDGSVHAPIVSGDNVTINWNSPPPPRPSEPLSGGDWEPIPPNLRQNMLDWLSKSDVNTICFDMNIQYSHLTGENHPEKVADLIRQCQMQKRVDELIKNCHKVNPNRNFRV